MGLQLLVYPVKGDGRCLFRSVAKGAAFKRNRLAGNCPPNFFSSTTSFRKLRVHICLWLAIVSILLRLERKHGAKGGGSFTAEVCSGDPKSSGTFTAILCRRRRLQWLLPKNVRTQNVSLIQLFLLFVFWIQRFSIDISQHFLT